MLMLWNWDPSHPPLIDGSHWTVPLQLMGFTVAALLFAGGWGRGQRIRWVLWVAVLGPILQWPIRVATQPGAYHTLVDGFGLHRWHLFVVGVAIWLWSTKRISTPHFAALLAAGMSAQALHNYSETPEGLLADWGSTVGICVGIVVIALVARGPDWDRIVPGWAYRPIQWFAGISYGVFLMHQSIGYVVMRRLQDLGIGPTLQTAAMVVTGVALGWILTHAVERPTYELLMSAYDRGLGSRWGFR